MGILHGLHAMQQQQLKQQETFMQGMLQSMAAFAAHLDGHPPMDRSTAGALPVRTAQRGCEMDCEPTALDSTGCSAPDWEAAVSKPPKVAAKSLAPEAEKHYMKVSRKFEDVVDKYLRGEHNLLKAEQDIMVMKEDGQR